MKKRLLTGCLCIVLTNSSFGMHKPVQLPSAEILEQRLNKINFAHFAKKTNLHKTLDNQTITPIDIMLDTNIALINYSECYQCPKVYDYLEKHRPNIIKAILQDHPQALDDLKQKGLLENPWKK